MKLHAPQLTVKCRGFWVVIQSFSTWVNGVPVTRKIYWETRQISRSKIFEVWSPPWADSIESIETSEFPVPIQKPLTGNPDIPPHCTPWALSRLDWVNRDLWISIPNSEASDWESRYPPSLHSMSSLSTRLSQSRQNLEVFDWESGRPLLHLPCNSNHCG